MLGLLVHDHHVADELRPLGVETLDGGLRESLLDNVPEGATVIFTAHGVSPAVRERAFGRGLHVLDATCSEARRTPDVIREYVDRGYFVIYVGTAGHPEPEGALGVAPPGRIVLVTAPEEVPAVPFAEAARISVVIQTTLIQWDTAETIAAVRRRYPKAVAFNEICL